MDFTTTNNVVINKLTLAKYKELKANNQISSNEVYSISDLDEYIGSTEVRDITGQDLNNLIGEFIIGYGNDLINKPQNANGYLINLPHSFHPTTYNRQYFQARQFNTLYTRCMENGIWSGWKKISVDKDYQTAYLPATTTISATGQYVTIPLTNYTLIGDGLSVTSDGGIKIGGVIRGVRISAQVTFTPGGGSGIKHIRVNCGGSDIGWTNARVTATNQSTTLTIPTIIKNVTTNDVVYLKYYGASGDTITGSTACATYLTVEAIE